MRQQRRHSSAVTGGRIRIIAGRWRGRFIDVPQDAGVRPTPNRVRETLFNWLQNEIAGARCLDLFAGSGALGIEALSRGAGTVTFVDANSRLTAALQKQLLRLGAQAAVICAGAEDFIFRSRERFDIIFVDPPFDLDAAPICSAAGNLLADAGALYCERDAGEELPVLEWGRWQRTARAGAVRFGLARRD